MNRLVIFDIEYDKIDKLVEVFAKYDIQLNKKFYKHVFETPFADDQLHTEWNQIQFLYPQFAYNATDGFDNEWDRIQNVCNKPNTTDNIITDEFQDYIIKTRFANETFLYKPRDILQFCRKYKCHPVHPKRIWLPNNKKNELITM